MLEIKLCRHARMKHLCDDCLASNRDLMRQSARACSDCTAYAFIQTMTTKPDGRVICQSCQKAIDTRARERAQADLFVSQPVLF